jgi:integrase/recombinase XerD
MEYFGLKQPYANEYPLFNNGRRGKLTRMAVANVVTEYAEKARTIDPIIIPKITPHSLRHSKAMLMMKAGVNLVAIRDFLGHASITSTEIYARLDNQQKLDAINKTSLTIEPSTPSWQKDKGLLLWCKWKIRMQQNW